MIVRYFWKTLQMLHCTTSFVDEYFFPTNKSAWFHPYIARCHTCGVKGGTQVSDRTGGVIMGWGVLMKHCNLVDL